MCLQETKFLVSRSLPKQGFKTPFRWWLTLCLASTGRLALFLGEEVIAVAVTSSIHEHLTAMLRRVVEPTPQIFVAVSYFRVLVTLSG